MFLPITGSTQAQTEQPESRCSILVFKPALLYTL